VLEGPSRTLAAGIVKVKVKVKGESGEGSVAMGSGKGNKIVAMYFGWLAGHGPRKCAASD
jgi:hypothetical protein